MNKRKTWQRKHALSEIHEDVHFSRSSVSFFCYISSPLGSLKYICLLFWGKTLYSKIKKNRYLKVLHIVNVVGWWTKFTKGRKPKAEENVNEEADTGKNVPLLELTEDEYEEFHSKFPLPWWCIIIAYLLSILSIFW